MKNKFSCLTKSDSGRAQSLVEFAISLLLILTILTGAVEVSLALFEYVTIRNAAQEGALFGSINPKDTTQIRARVKDAANDSLQLADGNILISSNGNYCEGSASGLPIFIRITINYPHRIVMPLAGSFLGQQINLTASVTNTILQPTCP